MNTASNKKRTRAISVISAMTRARKREKADTKQATVDAKEFALKHAKAVTNVGDDADTHVWNPFAAEYVLKKTKKTALCTTFTNMTGAPGGIDTAKVYLEAWDWDVKAAVNAFKRDGNDIPG